jgi:hypothetical protein
MNKEQQDLLDKAYENYSKEYEKNNSIGMCLLVARLDGKKTFRKPDKEMFVGLCTSDKTFSEKWGLKIEERELSLEERKNIWLLKNSDKPHLLYHPGMVEKSHPLTTPQDWFDEQNIPTKLITISYNDKTIESYE